MSKGAIYSSLNLTMRKESHWQEGEMTVRSRSESAQPIKTPLSATGSQYNPFTVFYRVVGGDEPSWLQDLELMHHYTIYTSNTLSNQESLLAIWRDEFPRLAVSHNFLMHGLLALSALHLAHLRPAARHTYYMISSHHQNLAIGTFRTVLPQITRDNASAFFALSAILSLFTFATGADSNRPVLQMGDVAECFQLVRGVRGILNSSWEWVSEGPLSPLLHVETPTPTTKLSGEFAERVQTLGGLIASQSYPEDIASTLTQSIEKLMRTFAVLAANADMRGKPDLEGWMFPCVLPLGFHGLLLQPHPAALLVVAYYCVLQKPCEEVWFMNGWSDRVMVTLEHAMDPEWKCHLEWPKSKVADRWNAVATENRAA